MENDSMSKEAYLLAYHACIKGGKLTVKGMVGLLKLEDILKLVNVLVVNTKGEGTSNDPFWEKAEKLGVVSIKEITKNAKERRPGSLGFSEAMLIIYNKRMKNGLKWNNLYSIKAGGGNKEKGKKKDDRNENLDSEAS